ncbi:uncharacterized protein LOC118816821 [Colossoma macropomum]|uniref:uncharacterized protein LOC118816821 n=1 Tax=Colossoma macropomum TaxID=42526 RepID=UPI001864C603|nr:uncharacterized protein LOC118816821 [Colossoma macropomum]
MVRIDTLNELSQLRDSGFGQPNPRHGLNLLYWFAHEYVEIDSHGRMIPNTSPTTGAYGFHLFHNFKDEDDYLLPSQNLPYYGVGNLGVSNAYKLPLYVRKDYTHLLDDSNKDRIMVRLKDGYLERVYITEHTDQTRFGQTYRISQGLIMNIKRLQREDFLQQMKPFQSRNQSYTSHNQSYTSHHKIMTLGVPFCRCAVSYAFTMNA